MTSPTNPIAPPCVLFWRPRLLIRALALAAVTLAAGEAMGQLDLTHNWARVFGGDQTNSSDVGTGTAVLTDGTVVTTGWYHGNLLIEAPAPSYKAFTTFLPGLDGNPVNGWMQKFEEVTQWGGNVQCLATSVSSTFVDTRKHAYVAGWYSGTINFKAPAGTRSSTENMSDAFVAKLIDDPANNQAQQTLWVTGFGGTGYQQATCLAAGPKSEPPEPLPPPQGGVRHVFYPYQNSFVAVGGYFSTQMTFPSAASVLALGGEDGWLGLFVSGSNQPTNEQDGGAFLLGLTLGSAGTNGNDRVTAIAVDQADQCVIVGGYFSQIPGQAKINFNPNGSLVEPPSFAGGTDIFVAKYSIQQVGQDFKLLLDWVFTTGTSGDDSAAGVAVDAAGDVYATGWKRDAGGKRDVWTAKVLRTGPVNNTPNWQYTYTNGTNYGDDAGLGITLDGLDRPLITGQFGYTRTAGGGDTPTYTLDFNRAGAVSNLTTAGGLDLFVTRLRPGGEFDWAYCTGYTFNEVGSAIAADPVFTTRIAHTGWFGDPDATVNYPVDFDPGTGNNTKLGKGYSDAFVASLRPTIPANVKTQTSLVIDNSGSVDDTEYATMMSVFNTHLHDSTVVPQNSRAALNAVFFSSGKNNVKAIPVIPWTVFTATTADLFARKLSNLARYQDIAETFAAEGVDVAVDSHSRAATAQGLDACYHSIDLVSDGITEPSYDLTQSQINMDAARNAAILSAYVDQTNAIAVQGATDGSNPSPDYFLNHFIDSDTVVNGVSPPYDTLGFQYYTVYDGPNNGFSDPKYTDYIRMMLMRSTHLPGDFDLNGTVNNADLNDPMTGFTARRNAHDPYADWNFDGAWDGIDTAVFSAAKALGNCP